MIAGSPTPPEPSAVRIETPGGSFLYREIPDASPAVALRWRRGVAILEALAAEVGERRAAAEAEGRGQST